MSHDQQQKDYDLVVIGSGPAGYRAAMQAGKLKKRVCVIEKTPDRLGGSWIHTGTIPSKTLRESMDAIHSIRFHAGSAWVDRIITDLSTTKLFGQATKVAQYEESIVRRYFERHKVEVISGYGMIDDRHTVRILGANGDSRTVSAEKILIATGSRPRRPDDIPFDGWRVIDADEILRLECLPKSLLIYGAGVIACEYACIFNALGVKITLIDGRTTIMQFVDHQVSAELRKSMEERGIQFVMGSKLAEVRINGPHVSAHLEDGKVVDGDVLFYAAGRTPNTERLGLDKLGIKLTDRGEILVNADFQTAIPTIYAAGDTIGSPALAATAQAQGRHAALHMFGSKAGGIKPFPEVYPLGVYTIPELSSVGKTEQDLKAAGVDYVVGRSSYSEVARGYIRGDEHGLLKLIVCRKTHKILGIHIIGHDACNLVHIGLAFMQMGGHAQDLVDMIFNYPTLAEAYRIAAFNALNKLFPSGEIGDPPTAEEIAKSSEGDASDTPPLVPKRA